MENQNFEHKNQIICYGTVITNNVGLKFAEIKVGTNLEGKHFYPTFSVYDTDMIKNVKVGDRVFIQAHAINRRVKNSVDGTKFKRTYVADKIDVNKRALSFFFDEEKLDNSSAGFPRDRNEVLLAGEVSHSYEVAEDIVILTLKCNKNYCDVTCFKNQAEIAKNLKVGDPVVAVGYIQTSYNNMGIVLRDIAKYEQSK